MFFMHVCYSARRVVDLSMLEEVRRFGGVVCGVGVFLLRLNNKFLGLELLHKHLMAPKHNTLKLPRAIVDQLGGDGNEHPASPV